MDGRDAAGALAKVAGRGLALKAGAIGAAGFLIFLLITGLFGAGMGGKAFADSCGGRGTPGVDLGDDEGAGQTPSGNLRKDQIANAKIIDQVAVDGGLSGRATLIALMTALQESTLINLDHGHLDSIGLFQQRPSQGWGTNEEIMKPKYAAGMFLFGDDPNSARGIHGLTDIRSWQTMPLGMAAQEVQRSAFPDLYAGQEDAARQIADQAGIDLDRKTEDAAGNEDQADDATNGDDEADSSEECYPDEEEGAGAGKPGEPFHDGNAPWPNQVKNPRSAEAAIAWAEEEAKTGGKDWWQLCLAFVAVAHGWNYSGVPYAIDHYKEMPESMKHDKDRSPPPGALMYWDTGQRAGHVAIYLGNGKIASNDIKRMSHVVVR